MNESRLEILKKIEDGILSAEEGLRLISLIESEETSAPSKSNAPVVEPGYQDVNKLHSEERFAQPEVVSHGEAAPDFSNWKIWSWAGFGFFVLLTAVSAVWMIQGWVAHPWGWGFWLSWIPFLIGVAGMATMFNTHWLHIRVRQAHGEKPERIAISMPFPLGLVSWVFKTFPQWMPEKTRGVDIGDILDEMNRGITKDQPIVIQVDDDNGEHVEIYIG